ncbi:MAG: hypothetical protein H8D46_02430, partial [FCB group bacterium]|nr:hypothetical protein [FCB group bacterium]
MRIFLFSVIILILSCAKSTNPVIHVPPDDYGIQAMLFGTDSTFEVLSWNIENFPKNSNTTVEYAARIL